MGECFSTSDHNIITCEICLPNPILCSENEKIRIRSFKNIDWNLIRADVACIDWESLFLPHSYDPDIMCAILRQIFDSIYEAYIPEIEIRPNRDAPWFSTNLKRMKKTRQRKWRVFKNNPSSQNRILYNNYCKTVKKCYF